MKAFRTALSVLLALLLGVSLCFAALSAAVFFTADRDAAFASPAMCEAVFENILASEDPDLVHKLENIPEFAAVQARYTRQLMAWRYDDGAPWDGLAPQEASAIATRLLQAELNAQDPAYAQHEDYETTLAQLSQPLQAALQDVFPSFDMVMVGTLRLQLDFISSLIRGSAALTSLIYTILLTALLILVSPNKNTAVHSASVSVALGAIFAILGGSSFRSGSMLLGVNSPLYPLRGLPKNCGTVLFCFAAAYLAVLIVLSLLVSIVVVPRTEEEEEEEEAPASVPAPAVAVEAAAAEPVVEAAPVAAPAPAPVPEPVFEPKPAPKKTQSAPVFTPLFSGASQYDLDGDAAAATDFDALLAQAAGPLFSSADVLSSDFADALFEEAPAAAERAENAENANYLDELQELFAGRVDNA